MKKTFFFKAPLFLSGLFEGDPPREIFYCITRHFGKFFSFLKDILMERNRGSYADFHSL